MRAVLLVRCVPAVALSLLFAAGCSAPPAVAVAGKVTRNGRSIELSGTEQLRLILIQEVPPGKNPLLRRVKAAPDGSFAIDNVPPGKYRVAVQQLDENTKTDALNDAFSAQNTPLVMDIDGAKPVEIDLDRPGG